MNTKRNVAVVLASATLGLWATSAVESRRSDGGSAVTQVQERIESQDETLATTRHEITIGRQTLKYTARAGMLPIRHDETGEIRGHIFFMAYLLDRQPNEPPRPLTFLWNGGPGANSTLVHLIAFGPRRIKIADDPTGPRSCECELEDNQTTWLDRTDLVFVDPIGTGFSRPTRPEYAAEFFNTLGDIATTAEFLRVYRTRFGVGEAPLFLAGESFGVWRAAGVAEVLERRGQRVAGVMLISGGMALGAVGTDEMRTALVVPTRTAAAFFHKKLSPALQTDLHGTLTKAETWARTDYVAALTRRERLSELDRQAIVTELSRFTGIEASLIDTQTLIVARQQFAEQLLRDQQRVLARFDTRQTTSTDAAGGGARVLLVRKYLRSVLQFKTDLTYQGLEEGYLPAGEPRRSVNARWNYNSGAVPAAAGAAPDAAGRGNAPPTGPRSTDAPPGAEPWLRRAIAINPSLKAFVAAGLYDSLNSCALNAHIVRTLEPALARNITAACYEGGHMMYEDRSVRLQMKRDIDTFFENTLAARPAGK